MKNMRALSIRQPYAEQILRGKKKVEYPGRPTNIRERVYIYASLTPGYPEDWEEIKMQPGDLPRGVLVGTVEIKDCTGEPGDSETVVRAGQAALGWRSERILSNFLAPQVG